MWGPLVSAGGMIFTKVLERRDQRDRRDFEARVGEPETGRVFISYSRSEAPLVVDMVERFDKLGVATFVDFRNLEPGTPWDDTLNEAINDASTIVLVVSHRSVWDSDACKKEVAHALAQRKRIVLAIAEPVALPEGLASCEWIDLRRGGFREAVAALAERINHPAAASSPAPTSGSRRPPIVWLAVALAALTAALAVPLAWTIVIPVLLLPLPMRILTRDFHYQATRSALLGQAVAILVLVGEIMLSGDGPTDAEVTLFLLLCMLLIPIPLLLLAVLRSRRFRRWMAPAAARPIFPVLPNIDDAAPGPQRYTVHHAPQDDRYVEEFTNALDGRGHVRVTADEARAGSVVELRFVSKFNDTDELPAETGSSWTLPIMISEPDDALPRRLTESQWLDLRSGGRERRARAVACLAAWFDRPKDLLRPLGVPSPHGIPIVPRGVQALHDLLWTCIVAIVLAIVVQVVLTPVQLSGLGWAAALGCGLGFVALAARTVDRLSNRRPTVAWVMYVPASVALFATAVTILVGWDTIEYIFAEDPEPAGPDPLGAGISNLLLFLAWIGLPIGWLFTWRETRMWIPSTPEDDRTTHRRGSDIRSAAHAARGALRSAWNDATGRTLLERRARRRDRQAAASESCDRSHVS